MRELTIAATRGMMPDSVLLEIAKEIPFAALLFSAILIFLRHLERKDDKQMQHEKEMESLRINAAKEREMERRAFDNEVNNMWAGSIKNIVEQQEKATKLIADALADHERSSKERYDKMSITSDLLDVAKDALKKR